MRYGRYVRISEDRLKLGEYLFHRRGGKIVFFGRFVAPSSLPRRQDSAGEPVYPLHLIGEMSSRAPHWRRPFRVA